MQQGVCTQGEAAKAKAVLVRNGTEIPSIPKDQLLKQHAGAYTTARTVDQRLIFEFSMHCSRLSKTILAILQKNASEGSAKAAAESEALTFFKDEALSAQKLKKLVAREVNEALQRLGDDGSGREYQVTVLITCETVGPHTPAGRGFDMFTYVQPMPSIAPMVDAQARPAKRNNPTIKDVQWVLDRQDLEKMQKKAGVNEILMFDEDGSVTEGLSSNVFAVAADGTVLTAPTERVLAGTVRKVVVEVCEKHGIPLRYDCPNIKDFTTWDSCFVCSTSRLAKPISKLEVPDSGLKKEFPAEGSVAHRIEALVRDAVRENSESFSGTKAKL